MSNDITALRTHLFDALKGLKDGTVDIEKAKAISGVAQVIINTAKVEVEFARVTGGNVGSEFISINAPTPAEQQEPTPQSASPLKTISQTTGLPPGITARHIHRLKD
jgi:hypothetical protein